MIKTTKAQKSSGQKYDAEAARLETDKMLEDKVNSALRANVFIDCTKIKVRVTDCLVYLEGTVHHQKERISAQKCLRDIFGISAVINYLTFHNENAE